MAAKLNGGFYSGGFRRHRRHRASIRRLLAFLFKYAGDQLYYLGATIERNWHGFKRSVRKGTKRAFRATVHGLLVAGNFVLNLLSGFLRDITTPFVKIVRGVRKCFAVMRSNRGKPAYIRRLALADFISESYKNNKDYMARFFNSFLPLVSGLVLVFTLYSLLNLQFGLAITYNGQHVGYVDSESTFDAAQKILQQRIIYSTDEDSVWSAGDAVMSVVAVDKSQLSGETRLADALLTASGAEITEATGLYIGGEFYGATVAKTLLEDLLDSKIQPYIDAVAGDPETTVKFARDVELTDGIYPATSVLTYDEIEKIVNSSEASDIYHTISDGETLEEIASNNGISIDRLTELNSWISGGYQEGDKLLVAVGEPLIGVKTVKIETYTETIDCDTVTIEDARFYVGYSRTIMEGRDGEKLVTVEVEYENGQEISREVISETVTLQPVDKQVIRGTKYYSVGGPVVGTGVLAWPTGSGYFVSRGWSSTHHGIDIAAPIGTGIFAADSGTVVTAQWTNTGYGYYIIVDHGNGISTLYAHNSQLLVNVGQTVRRGQLIALMGSTGNSTGSHLHFEVRLNGQKTDPAPYIY